MMNFNVLIFAISLFSLLCALYLYFRFVRTKKPSTDSAVPYDWYSQEPVRGGAAEESTPAIPKTNATAFSPPVVACGSTFLVQAAVHTEEQAETIATRAAAADRETQWRATIPLGNIEDTTTVKISLEIPDCKIEEPVRFVRWNNEPILEGFSVTAPVNAPSSAIAYLRLSVNNSPIGAARWRMQFKPYLETIPEQTKIPCEIYRYVFLSYSSEDRPAVIQAAMGMKAVGVKFFADVVSMDPGVRWKQRLYEEISECDAFILFWSSAASNSSWVLREAKWAVDCRERNGGSHPDIRPVILEAPPPPPPDWLNDIHFNDLLAYLLRVENAERRRPRKNY